MPTPNSDLTGDPVRSIARAVLYEGYLLWPYRHSALKNQRRWTFGAVVPHDWQERGHDDDACTMRAECLIELPATNTTDPTINVSLRFLQVVERQVAELRASGLCFVSELDFGGTRYSAGDEAVEREVTLEGLRLDARHELSRVVSVAADKEIEWLHDATSAKQGALVRQWRELQGTLTARAELIAETGKRQEGRTRSARVTLTLTNLTRWRGPDREDALRSSFLSTHFVLRVDGAAFVSLTDPPSAFRDDAVACRNEGCWPVLVGEPGDRSTMLAAPIILPDYPRIAPESPGDLFDGGEIDELLMLNILGLTDEERQQLQSSDPRAREILERTMSLTPEQMIRLHGTIREHYHDQ